MMKRIFGLLLLLVSCAALAVPVAYVHGLQGEARASTKSVSRVLQTGSTLEQGDEVSVSKGTVTLKFEDGQIVGLQQGSRFSIVNYQYNKARVADSSVVLSLLAGGMRYITGVIGGTRREAIRLQAGTATIGIRGTDTIIFLDSAGNVLATVQDGVISFTSAGVTATLNGGQGSTSTANQAPGNAMPVGTLPRGTVNSVTPLGLLITPANNPVNVTASAALVAAVADVAKKAADLAAAEKAAAAAITEADKLKTANELAAARDAAVAAARDAAVKAAAEAAATQQAAQIALQGGGIPTTGTPMQGQGVGLQGIPLSSDPAMTIISIPAAPAADTTYDITFTPTPTTCSGGVSGC